MKIIFLDFDGVINNAAWIYSVKDAGITWRSYTERHYKEINPAVVKLVSDFALTVDAKIVVSSSWRILNTLEELRDFLRVNGMDESVLPIDVTPRSDKGFRGDEVKAWLDNHPEVTAYVIFDDDGDFHPEQPLVKTTWDGGLLPDHIDIARGVLLHGTVPVRPPRQYN